MITHFPHTLSYDGLIHCTEPSCYQGETLQSQFDWPNWWLLRSLSDLALSPWNDISNHKSPLILFHCYLLFSSWEFFDQLTWLPGHGFLSFQLLQESFYQLRPEALKYKVLDLSEFARKSLMFPSWQFSVGSIFGNGVPCLATSEMNYSFYFISNSILWKSSEERGEIGDCDKLLNIVIPFHFNQGLSVAAPFM